MPSIGDIYYHFSGEGGSGHKPVVVLIHGAGGSHLHWPAEVRRLRGCLVYAPDLPGHGKSDGRSRQTIGDYADVLIDWLTELGIHSAFFIGHSMGSAIALTLGLDHPEHVSGLVLIGGGVRLKVSSQLLDYTDSPTTYLTAIKTLIDWSFSEHTPIRMKELAEKRMAETRLSVLSNDLHACDEFDETNRIERIRRPTLILCGREDRMTPLRYSQFLSEKIPGAVLRVIPDAGHMVQLEKPFAVADLTREFLTSIKYL